MGDLKEPAVRRSVCHLPPELRRAKGIVLAVKIQTWHLDGFKLERAIVRNGRLQRLDVAFFVQGADAACQLHMMIFSRCGAQEGTRRSVSNIAGLFAFFL